MRQLKIYLEWKILSDQINELKKQEAELRQKLCRNLLKNSLKPVKIDLEGYTIKAKPTIYTKLDQEEINSKFNSFSSEIKEAIRVKYELAKKEYDTLSEFNKNILDKYIIETAGMPSLKVERKK